MDSLQRQKCQVCEEGWHCRAPQNPLQTPRKEPRLKLLWEERKCLPASSRPCYSIFMCRFGGGGDSLIKHGKKSNSEQLLFWIWGLVWCLQGCTVMEKLQNNRHTTVFSFVVQRISPPVVSPSYPWKKKNTSTHILRVRFWSQWHNAFIQLYIHFVIKVCK